MILYLNDWKKYPKAQPHYNTTNKSWVRLAGIFHKMGVKNCLFHLALHNPLLKDVDPHSANLTEEEIIMIVQEAKENPWYVLREIIRIPPVAGVDPVMLKANRANVSLFWLFFNHITTMLIQPRQTGKSVSTDSLMVTLFGILTLNTDFNLLTKDDSLRVKNVARIKELLNLLPPYLRLRTRKDTNNTEKLTLDRLGNTYFTSVPQASERAALNLGRGMTIAINHIDEIAFVVNIDITLPALLAASSAARDSAAEQGAPYGNIFTTTPGYLSSKSGRFAYSIYSASLRWSELLFDSFDENDLKETIKKNSPGGKLQVVLDYNHRQLGFTDEWLRGKIEDAMSDGEDAGADFLNLWAEGSETSPIKKELLKIIKDSLVQEPYLEVSKYGYITRWYIPEAEVLNKCKTRYLVMSLDTSDAVGKDDIGMCIRDANTGEVVATGVYNETNLITFSEWIADWLIDYPNMLLIIERRSSGVAIIDNLIKLLLVNDIDPFKRIFNWVVNDADTNIKYRQEVIDVNLSRRSSIVYEKYRDKFGYATSGGTGRSSRNMLYGDVFNSSIKYTGSTVRDKTLIDQISSLTIRNDRIDHKSGMHDDLVIAWLLGYYVLSKGTNNKFYGLESHRTLSTVTTAIIDEQGGQEAVRHKLYHQKLKEHIDNLLESIRKETSQIKIFMLTNKIKHLYKELDTTVVQPLNIDSIIDNIMIEKRKKNFMR
jgi:hypothetical protein